MCQTLYCLLSALCNLLELICVRLYSILPSSLLNLLKFFLQSFGIDIYLSYSVLLTLLPLQLCSYHFCSTYYLLLIFSWCQKFWQKDNLLINIAKLCCRLDTEFPDFTQCCCSRAFMSPAQSSLRHPPNPHFVITCKNGLQPK